MSFSSLSFCVVGFEPGADVTMVHHLILFGCDKPYSTGQWDCKVMGGTCEGRQKILYAWARNASGLELPKSEIYVVLASHQYLHHISTCITSVLTSHQYLHYFIVYLCVCMHTCSCIFVLFSDRSKKVVGEGTLSSFCGYTYVYYMYVYLITHFDEKVNP